MRLIDGQFYVIDTRKEPPELAEGSLRTGFLTAEEAHAWIRESSGVAPGYASQTDFFQVRQWSGQLALIDAMLASAV